MSEEKFTKGNWIPSTLGFQVLGEDGHVSVCELNFPVWRKGEQIANSRLISAAPDLLKACQFAMQLVELADTFDIDLGKGWRDFKELSQLAIEKATTL